MANVKVKLTRNGPRQLRLLAAVQADLEARARRIASKAGSGMEVTTQQGRTRARASVVTATHEARRAEAEHRALTRALDSGR